MKKILLWLWQLPQNIIGFILAKTAPCKITYVIFKEDYNIYYRNLFNSGVCLGDYIILDFKCTDNNSILHEYGHHMQSLRLGWLYLLVIGIPSIIFNLYDRTVHKHWTRLQRRTWYYNLPWEAWADKLGGIVR